MILPFLLIGGVIAAFAFSKRSNVTPPDNRVPPGWIKRERFCENGCGWAYYYIQPTPQTILVPDKGEIEIVRL